MGNSLKRKQSKVLGLKIALFGALAFSVFSSTSFAKEIEPVAEKTCGSQGKPVYFNSSGAGLKDTQMGLVDGLYGPEFQIGKTRIFFSPEMATAGQPSQPGQNKKGTFKIIDGPDAKPDEKGKALSVDRYGTNSNFTAPENGVFMYPKILKIPGQNGEVARVEMWEERKNGKPINQFINVKGPDGKQSIRVDIDSKSKDNKVDVKMSIQAIPTSGAKCGISGIVETHVKGEKSQNPGSGTNESYLVKNCKNEMTGKDYSDAKGKDTPQKNTVDLDGIDFVVGKNRAPTNQFQCDQRVPRDDKEKSGTPAPPIAPRAIAGNGRS